MLNSVLRGKEKNYIKLSVLPLQFNSMYWNKQTTSAHNLVFPNLRLCPDPVSLVLATCAKTKQ